MQCKIFCNTRFIQKKNNSIIKKAPNLNYNSCYQTNFERQNVKLALSIFNEKIISALKSTNNDTNRETAEFIELILKWQTIVNIKNPV